jgi:hypothetical protein
MMINKQLIKLEIPGFEPRGAPDAPATAGRTAGSSPQLAAASTPAAPSAAVSTPPAPTHYTGKVPLSRRKRR